MTANLSPFDLALLRFAVPAVLFLPAVLREGLRVGDSPWRRAVLLTFLGGAPYALISAGGLVYAPASHAGVLLPGTMPLFTAVLGWILLKESLTPARIGGFLLIVLGGALVGWQGLSVPVAGQWKGDILFLVAALTWAGFTIALRAWQVTPLRAVGLVSVLSVAFYLPPYLLSGISRLTEAPVDELVLQIVYQGLFAGIIAVIAYTRAVNLLGAGRAAVFAGLVPCLAAFLAIPLLGETIGWIEAGGIAVVSIGIVRASGGRLKD